MFKIEQWVGIKGISFEYGRFNIGVFSLLYRLFKFRNNDYYIKNYFDGWKKLIFDYKKDLRLSLYDWTRDITILGLHIQINKYNEVR
jgi:hypothetical protein